MRERILREIAVESVEGWGVPFHLEVAAGENVLLNIFLPEVEIKLISLAFVGS